MSLPMRHLLAGSAVAGLLFLLPVGAPANAQDNRNTWSWVQTGEVVLSFIAAVGGATAVSAIVWRRLSKPGAEGKRHDGKVESALMQLNSSVKAVDTKLENVLNGVNGLTSSINALAGKLAKLEVTSNAITKEPLKKPGSDTSRLSTSPSPQGFSNAKSRQRGLVQRFPKEDSLAWADQELVGIGRKVREMEEKIKLIPSNELMSTGDAVRHLLHVDVKDTVEKIISVTGISDSQIPPYPGILDNMSIAKRWLQNTRKALDQYKLIKQAKICDMNNVNHNLNTPEQDYGLDPQNPWEISKG